MIGWLAVLAIVMGLVCIVLGILLLLFAFSESAKEREKRTLQVRIGKFLEKYKRWRLLA